MNNERKSNIILLIILIIVIVFGVFAYIRYQKGIEKTNTETDKSKDIELTSYTYGGVEKTSYMKYNEAVDKMIKFYNKSDGKSLASMKDFAAEAVYDHKGIKDFDSNLYTLVTDVYNYKDDYYANSLVVMCSTLLNEENMLIESTNKGKVKMKLKDLSELKQVEDSKYLYEAIAMINIDDKTNKIKVDAKTRIIFISYDRGKSFYLLKTERIE